jgi:hypothetical protein
VTVRHARNIEVGAGDEADGTHVELRLLGRSDKVFAVASLPIEFVDAFCNRLKEEAAKARARSGSPQ